MSQLIIKKLTTFRKAKKGALFLHGHTLVLKSEHSTKNNQDEYQQDAYIVGSGEYFWGGVDTVKERDKLQVIEVELKL